MPREIVSDVTDTIDDNRKPHASPPSPVSRIFHPNRKPPQPAPATTITNAPQNFFRLLSPSHMHFPRGHGGGLPFGDGPPAAPISPCVITFAFMLDPSAPLCHLPNTFFKDLQTNFPETFHACSGIHQSCFTLPFFTKNRQKPESPQHTPATSFTTIPASLVSPYVTLQIIEAAPHSEPRPSGRGHLSNENAQPRRREQF
jgi:hypothetical protein